ncbi:MAG: hypothetical protein OWQ54_05390 [Sulfolobaceae archaeon]|nr:hypothetical protein [Sulfolobaceae archaeon]
MKGKNYCPYYRNDYCTSPLLPSPDNTVTSPSRCLNNFKSCRFYVEKKDEEEGLSPLIQDEKVSLPTSFYTIISTSEKPIASECQYFKLFKTEKGYLPYCNVLKRVLTLSQASLCSTSPHQCPFRTLNP